jgi:hypothetical protein
MITTGNKAVDEALEIGLPTFEKLWEPTEDELLESTEIQRPSPIGLTSTSRKLARNWKAILDDSATSQVSNDHYLSESQVVSIEDAPMESDFVIALATFLVGRLTERFGEVRQVQLQLQEELARFSSK